MFSTGNVIRGNTIDGVHSLYYPREEWMYAKYPTPDGRWGDYVKAIHLDDQVGGFLIEGREMLSIFSVSVNFPVKNDKFTKTGSRQTQEKVQRFKQGAFSSLVQGTISATIPSGLTSTAAGGIRSAATCLAHVRTSSARPSSRSTLWVGNARGQKPTRCPARPSGATRTLFLSIFSDDPKR